MKRIALQGNIYQHLERGSRAPLPPPGTVCLLSARSFGRTPPAGARPGSRVYAPGKARFAVPVSSDSSSSCAEPMHSRMRTGESSPALCLVLDATCYRKLTSAYARFVPPAPAGVRFIQERTLSHMPHPQAQIGQVVITDLKFIRGLPPSGNVTSDRYRPRHHTFTDSLCQV